MDQDQNNITTNTVENKEISQTQNDQVINQVHEVQETQEQINWKKFREQREIERRQRVEAEKRAAEKSAEAEALKEAMEAILNKKSTNSVDMSRSYYSEEEETEDQKIQKKVEAALLERERRYEDERRKKEQAEYPQKLLSAYKDFNEVCTPDNLDYLEYHHPELAAPFRYMPDGFDKWAAVYQAVKKFVPNTDSKKDQKKAEKNFNKPQSMAASGVTQTGDGAPMMLDDKKRADNWSRMQRVMKGGR